MARSQVRDERKKQILKALDECLQEKSFEKTSIKDIARVAGVNHGVLHYYFKNKEDILLQYIDYVVDDFKGQVQEILFALGMEKLSRKNLLKEIFAFVNQKLVLDKRLNRTFIEIWEISLYNKAVRAKLKYAYQEWINVFDMNFKKGIKDTDNSFFLSILTVAFWEGMSLFSTIFEKRELDFQQVLDRFLQGILKDL